jgi:iron complex transport system substrate-binding protein
MRHRLWLIGFSLVLLAGLAGAGCQSTPAAPAVAPEEPAEAPTAAPTEVPAEEPAVEGGDEVVVVVSDVPFTMDDLQALEQVTVEATYKGEAQEYTGVRIQDLLKAASAEAGAIVLVGDDGYEAQVPVASLTDECLLAYRTQGGLRAVLPGVGTDAWVKGVVEVRCSGAESARGPVEVTDTLGRTVEFPELPQRIVVPGKGAWMVGHPLYLFPEASGRVLAMEARRGTVSDFIASIEPGFMDKPHLETDAAPEQIAPLNPDAIVMKSYMQERLGAPLEELGFPVVYVELETPEQFFHDVDTIGQMFGNQARAQEIQSFYQARLDRIQEGLAGLDDADKPRVLLVQCQTGGEDQAFTVPPVSWMQTIQVQVAGGIPVWEEAAESGGWQVVNFEQIAAWDPAKIFVVVFQSDPDPVMEQLKSDPAWQGLQAVQDGELYAFPADFYGWDVPDPRWILGMTLAATKIHPDRFADVDVMEEVYEFYGQMYGMDQAAVDEIIVPELKGDIQ